MQAVRPPLFPSPCPPLRLIPAGACGHPVKTHLGEKPSWFLPTSRKVDGREGLFVNSVQRQGACGWVGASPGSSARSR